MGVDGTGFTNLQVLDQDFPTGGLCYQSNTVYGVMGYSVFKMNTDGSGFTNIHSLVPGEGPIGTLCLYGDTLIGATVGATVSEHQGTIYAVRTDGSGFSVLYSFGSYQGEPAQPSSGFVVSGNTLYGVSEQGGAFGWGTVYSFPLGPRLNISAAGEQVVLSWPTHLGPIDFSKYVLYRSSSLTPPVVWTPVPEVAVISDGQFTVIEEVTGNQNYYRLQE